MAFFRTSVCDRKRTYREAGFELDALGYVATSPRVTTPPTRRDEAAGDTTVTPPWDVLLLHLREEISKHLTAIPQEKDAIRVRNPSQPNYHPLNVVYLAVDRLLQKKTTGKEAKRFYTSLSKADHGFFMECLNKGHIDEGALRRYRRLIPSVKREQLAFHLNRQVQLIKHPEHLQIYLSCCPDVIRVVDSWLDNWIERMHDWPRYYAWNGKVEMTENFEQLVPVSKGITERRLRELNRGSYLTRWKTGNAYNLLSELEVFEPLPEEEDDGQDVDVIVSEAVLSCFLSADIDQPTVAFQIPLRLNAKDGRKRCVFGYPLIEKELDLRCKQQLFFDRALTRLHGTKQRDGVDWHRCYGDWKLGRTDVRVSTIDFLQCPTGATDRGSPAKIFTKLEYTKYVYPRNREASMETFTAKECAQYWLYLFLRKRAEVHVAHVAPKTGERVADTLLTSTDHVLMQLPSFLQFQPESMSKVLQSVLMHLQNQTEGIYLLNYSAEHGLDCFKATDVTSGEMMQPLTTVESFKEGAVYDLRGGARRGSTCLTRIPYVPQKWGQIVGPRPSVRIPHTFPFPTYTKQWNDRCRDRQNKRTNV